MKVFKQITYDITIFEEHNKTSAEDFAQARTGQ